MIRQAFLMILLTALGLNLFLDYRVHKQGQINDEVGRQIQSLMRNNSNDEARLAELFRQDEIGNSQTDRLVMDANLIDIGLLMILLAFFLYEYNTNQRTQKALRSAMVHLNEVNESLRAAEAERSVFFKKTVHDLRNPLGSIRGFAELMKDDSDNPRSIAEMSLTIQRISDGTLALVNSILVSNRKSNLASNFRPVDLAECVAETCRFLEPMALVKGQKILFEAPPGPALVRGDALKMRDVFFNLIGNAIKFSPALAQTRVRFAEDGKNITVTIADEGPGLSHEDLSKLYLPGQKLSAKATGGEASSGFGLYSVKETVEMHGGRLEAFNNGGGPGASFVVRLPRWTEQLRFTEQRPEV